MNANVAIQLDQAALNLIEHIEDEPGYHIVSFDNLDEGKFYFTKLGDGGDYLYLVKIINKNNNELNLVVHAAREHWDWEINFDNDDLGHGWYSRQGIEDAGIIFYEPDNVVGGRRKRHVTRKRRHSKKARKTYRRGGKHVTKKHRHSKKARKTRRRRN